MKKIFSTFLLCFVFLISNAQQIFTLDITQPTSGTNFQSFQDAINWLDTTTINSDIVFNVFANQEFILEPKVKLTFSKNPGEFTITFQKYGDGNNPVIKGDSIVNDGLINLVNVTNYIFDGIDVTDKNPLNDSTIEAGYYLKPASNIIIRNCNVTNFRTTGIYCRYGCENILIENNNIYYTNNFNSFGATVLGIYCVSPNITNTVTTIKNNKIWNLKAQSTVYGIRVWRVKSLVANNFVSLTLQNPTVYGLRADMVSNMISEFYHNTVYLSNIATNAGHGLYTSGNVGTLKFVNNIIINNRYGTDPNTNLPYEQNAVFIGINNPNFYFNNNIYYCEYAPDNKKLLNKIKIGTTDYYFSTIESWNQATGLDAKSKVTKLKFFSPENGDLHLDTLIGDFILAGEKIPAITTDIDNQQRDTTYPYIGADEIPEANLNLHTKIDKDSLIFGQVKIGEYKIDSVRIICQHSSNVTIKKIEGTPNFLVKIGNLEWAEQIENYSITPDTHYLKIKFLPTNPQNYLDFAKVTLSNNQQFKIKLTGTGKAEGISLVPNTINFGVIQYQQQTASDTIIITNELVNSFLFDSVFTQNSIIKFKIENSPTSYETKLYNVEIPPQSQLKIITLFAPETMINLTDTIYLNSQPYKFKIPIKGRTQAINFTENLFNQAHGVYNGVSVIGDINNDNNYDIFFTGYGVGNYEASFYLNNGNGTFSYFKPDNFVGFGNNTADLIDFDNDGDLDVFIAGQYALQQYVAILYLNDGNNTFTELLVDFIPGISSCRSDWGDFDNDGFIDLAIIGEINSVPTTKIFKNINGQNLVEIPTQITNISSGAIKWIDIDNDNDLDIFLVGRIASWNYKAQIWENNNGTFTKILDTLAFRYASADIGDYNGDGFMDIICTGVFDQAFASKLILFKNLGNKTFQQVQTNILGISQGDIKFADLNQDGLLDICLNGIHKTDSLWIGYFYLNLGNDNFYLSFPDTVTSLKWANIAVGDINNDNRTDLFITGRYDYQDYRNYLYINNFLAINQKPLPPTQLTATTIGDTVIIEWNDGLDDKSPSLTYNLQIGSTPDSSQFYASNSSNGKHLLFKPGNCQTRKSAKFIIPQTGTYYISVQSIDNSYIASDFSEPIEIFLTKLAERKEGEFFIYPNPAVNYLNLDMSKFTNPIVSIYSINGIQYYKKQYFMHNATINIENLPAGIYIISLEDKNIKTSKLFIKK